MATLLPAFSPSSTFTRMSRSALPFASSQTIPEGRKRARSTATFATGAHTPIAFTTPPAATVATDLFVDCQIAWEVTSWVLPFEKRAVAASWAASRKRGRRPSRVKTGALVFSHRLDCGAAHRTCVHCLGGSAIRHRRRCAVHIAACRDANARINSGSANARQTNQNRVSTRDSMNSRRDSITGRECGRVRSERCRASPCGTALTVIDVGVFRDRAAPHG